MMSTASNTLEFLYLILHGQIMLNTFLAKLINWLGLLNCITHYFIPFSARLLFYNILGHAFIWLCRCCSLMSSLHAATKIAIFHVSQQIASLTSFHTLLPPLTLVLTNFSKNCHFPNYFQFLEKSQKLQKSQFLLGTFYLLYHLNLVILAKTAISPIFCKKLKTSKCQKEATKDFYPLSKAIRQPMNENIFMHNLFKFVIIKWIWVNILYILIVFTYFSFLTFF